MHPIDKFLHHTNKSGFGHKKLENKIKYFNDNGLSEYVYLIDNDTNIMCYNLYIIKNGIPKCQICNNNLLKLGRGYYPHITCSEECENETHSRRMVGENNASHKMTPEVKLATNLKISKTIKLSILEGRHTPVTNNYKMFGTLNFNINDKLINFRSLWEIVYYFLNLDSNFSYEKLRINYYDNVSKTNRVYITDFYDKFSNTIIEIKPKKYQYTLNNGKISAAISSGYNFCVIDEEYFKNILPTINIQQLISDIINSSLNYGKIEKRLLWLNRFIQK